MEYKESCALFAKVNYFLTLVSTKQKNVALSMKLQDTF